MFDISLRPRRTSALLAAGTAALAVGGPVVAQAASGAKPTISELKVTPSKPVQGKGFKVSFTTTSGGSWTVFEAASQSGGPLISGKAKSGATVKTKTVGKSLHAIKGLTIGVDLTSGGKTKRKTIKITIAK